MIGLFTGERFDTGCTITVAHTAEELHAHVELDGDVPIGPGDRVRVHGAPVRLPFGEEIVLRRTATVERAGLIDRVWTRLRAQLDITELYEITFTSEKPR
jgi:hypothetical protein